MKNIILIVSLIFVFTACSSKNNIEQEQKINNTTITKIAQITEDIEDDFEDEFEDEKEEIFDPLSGYNRVMTSFNDTVYMNVLIPVSKGYAKVLPQGARTGISNFFDNLMFPVRFTNNLLQLKFKNSTEELGRFVVNTVLGLGFFDPAQSQLGWEQHDEDFGQTLGFYGVGEGFHIVLPLLGPSNLRDIVGLSADSYVSALSTTGSSDIKYKIPNNLGETIAIQSVNTINEVSLVPGQYENIRKDALDLYPFLRDIYTQSRRKKIEE